MKNNNKKLSNHAIETEMRNSTDFWYSRVIKNITREKFSEKEIEKKMIKCLKNETPSLISAIMERSCIFQCKHCVFQKECSSQGISKKFNLEKIIYSMIRQLPSKEESFRNPKEEPMFIHEGRILKEWHLDIFKNIRKIRPDIKIGLIDNGSYTRLISEFKKRGVKLDWLDISIDGLKDSHNNQRKNPSAFDIALKGLIRAKEITLPHKKGGRISALFTITKLNYKDVLKTADFLFSNGLIDEFHITTIAPVRREHSQLEVSVKEFKKAWKQIVKIYKKYGLHKNGRERVFFRLYRHQDLEKLAYAVGVKKFLNAILIIDEEKKKNPLVEVAIGRIIFYIDGVPVTFSPLSTWPQETFLIDADGANRVAHSLKYTISDLRKGMRQQTKSSNYTVNQMNIKSDFVKSYHLAVDKWWEKFGKNFLREERDVFNRLQKLT